MQGSNRGKENRTGAYKKELKTGERTTTYKKVPLEKGIALLTSRPIPLRTRLELLLERIEQAPLIPTPSLQLLIRNPTIADRAFTVAT